MWRPRPTSANQFHILISKVVVRIAQAPHACHARTTNGRGAGQWGGVGWGGGGGGGSGGCGGGAQCFIYFFFGVKTKVGVKTDFGPFFAFFHVQLEVFTPTFSHFFHFFHA